MKRTKNLSRYWLLAIVSISCAGNLSAQTTTHATSNSNNQWHFLVEPYVMFPNMSGTIGLGNLPEASIDENPGDIFSNLQMGAMLYAEANKDKWTISSDFIYMKLGSDHTTSASAGNV